MKHPFKSVVSWGLGLATALASVVIAGQSQAQATGLAPVATSEQAQSGASIYAEKCTGCHSQDLGEGGHGPPLKGDYFWTTWGGQSARKLYGLIITAMPASDPGSLSPKEALALVAFVLRSNGYPAGGKALEQSVDLQDVLIKNPAQP